MRMAEKRWPMPASQVAALFQDYGMFNYLSDQYRFRTPKSIRCLPFEGGEKPNSHNENNSAHGKPCAEQGGRICSCLSGRLMFARDPRGR